MQARETQIIMQSLASRASCVEHGVAVVGDAVEDGRLAGAAGAFPAGGQDADAGLLDASRIDFSGGTVRVSPLWARWTSMASCSTGSVSGLATNRSTCSEPFGPGGAALLDGVEQRLGPAAVDLGVGLRFAEQAVEVDEPFSSCGQTVTRSP